MAVPQEQRDVNWLKTALQTAVAVEESTLPLYLSALFSLRVQNYTSYNLIRSVVMEEMVHMTIAANMLAAIGGTPEIAPLSHGFPSSGLPGGAEPDLDARLAKLSPRQLRNFMRVEVPGFLLPAPLRSETYPTIAALYGAISGAIDQNADDLRGIMAKGGTANQVGDNIGVITITGSGAEPVRQLQSGIREILEQGEGTDRRTLRTGSGSEDEDCHYLKFAEILYGHQFQDVASVELTTDTERQFFAGAPLPFPEVVNVLAVPADGYGKLLAADPQGAKVETALAAFDTAYTAVLGDLDGCWNGPSASSWPTLGKAVMSMVSLRVLSCFNIMRYEVPATVVARLEELYPDEYQALADYTDLSAPVFYGPRFVNTAAQSSVKTP
jgi:hypothetical protein